MRYFTSEIMHSLIPRLPCMGGLGMRLSDIMYYCDLFLTETCPQCKALGTNDISMILGHILPRGLGNTLVFILFLLLTCSQRKRVQNSLVPKLGSLGTRLRSEGNRYNHVKFLLAKFYRPVKFVTLAKILCYILIGFRDLFSLA